MRVAFFFFPFSFFFFFFLFFPPPPTQKHIGTGILEHPRCAAPMSLGVSGVSSGVAPFYSPVSPPESSAADVALSRQGR